MLNRQPNFAVNQILKKDEKIITLKFNDGLHGNGRHQSKHN